MKPYEFTRFYHPKLGRFVYKHKGSGIIVDNIFKPMKRAMSSVVGKIAKPFAKKALKSGVSHAGEQVGKKMSENAGDLIMKRLQNLRQQEAIAAPTPVEHQQQDESTDMILNRLISGSGMKRRRKVR